ncbi:hypothetical protein [Halorussus halophilus]|nr:hypothetical protein [Halorussus halophilus]
MSESTDQVREPTGRRSETSGSWSKSPGRSIDPAAVRGCLDVERQG